jgi:hypothetical protein
MHPLQFSNMTHQRLRYTTMTGPKTFSPNRTEVVIPASRTTEGVYPKGSVWTKNPVPIGTSEPEIQWYGALSSRPIQSTWQPILSILDH